MAACLHRRRQAETRRCRVGGVLSTFVVLFSDYVLDQLRLWWLHTGRLLSDGPTFEEVFDIVLEMGGETLALWDGLPVLAGDRLHMRLLGPVPLALTVTDYDGDLLVYNIQFLSDDV